MTSERASWGFSRGKIDRHLSETAFKFDTKDLKCGGTVHENVDILRMFDLPAQSRICLHLFAQQSGAAKSKLSILKKVPAVQNTDDQCRISKPGKVFTNFYR
jgi:hypothetical protein